MAPKSNGFMVFTLDWKNKCGKKMSIGEATTEAGKIWKNMDAAARAPYNERAKKQTGLKKVVKLTCTGKPVAEVERERQEAEQKERDMKRYIEMVVRNAMKNGTLQHQRYFFIMVNYFAKTLVDGIHVPAEIAVAEFSLKDGVSRTYHSLINPGREIFGHQYEAKQYSESTHALPLPPNAMGSTDLGKIYNDILEFVYDKETREYAPVYAPVASIPIVRSVLKYMKCDSIAMNIDLRLYSIQYLMFIMKDATCELGENEKITSYHVIEASFANDFFEYESGIGCEFHEECDRTKYCTKSYVTRWGYMFADMMCGDIAVDLIPGRHCPVKTNLEKLMTITYTKSYLEEMRSNRSTKDTVSVLSMNTNITAPIAGGGQGVADNRCDWPTLNTHKHKEKPAMKTPLNRDSDTRSITGQPHAYSAQERSDHRAEDALYNVAKTSFCNPWSARSRVVPPPPDSSSFAIDTSSVFDDDNISIQSSGYGRGSLISNNQAWGRGRGRGFPPL